MPNDANLSFHYLDPWLWAAPDRTSPPRYADPIAQTSLARLGAIIIRQDIQKSNAFLVLVENVTADMYPGSL